jgi:hypothetical protein
MFIVPWFWWRSLMNMFTVIHFLIHQRHCHKNRLVEDLTSTEHANIASLFVKGAIWMTFGCKKCHTFAYICIHLQYMHWNASIKLSPIEQNIQILKIKGTTYPWRSVSRHLMTAVCPKPNKSKNWKTLLPNYCCNLWWIGKKGCWFETLAKHVRCVWYHPFVTVLKKKYRKSVFNNTNLGFVKFKDNCETVANILLKSMFFFNRSRATLPDPIPQTINSV